MTSQPVNAEQRFNAARPCPICGGHPALPQGAGIRCWGYYSTDGVYAHCVRERLAGQLDQNPSSNTFAHRLQGDCHCGVRHGNQINNLPSPITRDSGSKTLEATYDYRDEDGKLAYQVLKYRYQNGAKDFKQRRPDGRGGWIWKKGITPLPYRLDELVSVPLGTPVYVPEGEKDVDRLIDEEGLAATCNSGGAGNFPPELSKWFQSRQIVLLEDNDEKGRQHVRTETELLTEVARSIKVPSLPGLNESEDVSDWLDAGHTVEELKALVKATPEYAPATNATMTPSGTMTRDWPEPLADEAYHGLIGEFVHTIEEHTESDPASLLLNMLVYVGNAIGRGPYATAEADRHGTNIYAVLVGETSKARKGSSDGHIRKEMTRVVPEWADHRIMGGLSSGEGLIWAVRDPIEKQEPVREQRRPTGEYDTVIVDSGVADKRLLIRETEFASVLKVMSRDGNTLSALVRQAWDSGDLRTLTKNSPAVATGAHISIMGHITKNELLRHITDTELANGFANRFLWVCAKRARILPEGGGTPNLQRLTPRLQKALIKARTIGQLSRDDTAREAWAEVYPDLSNGKPGLFGAAIGRAEAQVVRLSVIYAALDGASAVRMPHLTAALAVWEYCERSASYIFGDATGDPVADRLFEALKVRAEMTRTDINTLLGRHTSGSRIAQALNLLLTSGKATFRMDDSQPGRPRELWSVKGF